MMKIKKRLLYHGHRDDQAKVTDCTMGTVLIEDQERVTVLWAHCWRTSTYMHRDQKGSNPLIILFYTEGRIKVSVPWVHCWDPRKCHCTMGTYWGPSKGHCHMCIILRSKEGLLNHGHSVDGQEMVTVASAPYWGPRKCYCSRGTLMSVKLLAAIFCYVWH
jgi:hypothetical protein